MWWFLVIAFVAVVLLWQVPGVGPLLAITLIVGLVALFWWVMKNSPKSPPKQKRPEPRQFEVKVDPSKLRSITAADVEAARQQSAQQERIYTSRVDAGRIAGEIEGQHYTKWMPVIEQLNREGKLNEALSLTLECIDAAERQAKIDGFTLPRGYTRRAAIIYRKLGDLDGEVAVLERFLASGSHADEIVDRLAKAKTLRDKKK